jgi:hypothetical protein
LVRSTSTEILISLVVIMCTLIFSADSAENIRPATPSSASMPTPTTETFAIRWSCDTPSAPIIFATRSVRSSASARSSSGTVNEMSARPPCPTFCTIMSTAIPDSASAENNAWLEPGWSGAPSSVIRASSLARAMPLTGRFTAWSDARISVPGMSLKLDRTTTFTPNFLANSIDRECITPAPRLASSSISS